MSTRIMVAVHNGTAGLSKIELATGWANRLGGSVVGVGVIDRSIWAPAGVSFDSPIDGQPLTKESESRRDRAEEHVIRSLNQLEQHCRKAGIGFRRIQETGTPHEQILLEAQRHDVVLLGKESNPDPGLGVPEKTILESVLRHSPRPVVAVPDELDGRQGILVAYDGSLQAARALMALVASGLAALGDVRILSLDRQSEEEAAEHAGRAAGYLAAHGIEAEAQPRVTDTAPETAIAEEADRQAVELIVMGAYGRSQLAEFFLGSATTGVIDEAAAPVFLFH